MCRLQPRGKRMEWIDAASTGVGEAAAARLLAFLQAAEAFADELYLDLQARGARCRVRDAGALGTMSVGVVQRRLLYCMQGAAHNAQLCTVVYTLYSRVLYTMYSAQYRCA